MKEMTVDIEISKRGLPCLWECGGGMSNTGRCQIVADGQGRAKTPIYVRTKGMLSNNDHALIPIAVGDIVIKTYHHRLDFSQWVYRIDAIDLAEKKAHLSQIATFSNGEWDDEEVAEKFADAIAAADKKATTYHCREAMYVRLKQPV